MKADTEPDYGLKIRKQLKNATHEKPADRDRFVVKNWGWGGAREVTKLHPDTGSRQA